MIKFNYYVDEHLVVSSNNFLLLALLLFWMESLGNQTNREATKDDPDEKQITSILH